MKTSRIRIVAVAAASLVLVAAATAWWFVSSLDRRVAAIIEREGSALTGTTVRVSSVSLSLRDGTGQVRGLRVANPAGFSSGDALRIDTLTLRVDTSTLRKRPLILKDLVMEAPEVRLEMNRSGATNLDALRKAVERNAASAPADPDPLKLRILQVDMPRGRVEADMSAAGAGTEEVALETIRLTNVGGKSGGTTDAVAKILVGALVKETTRAATKDGLMRRLGGKTGGIGEKMKGLFNK